MRANVVSGDRRLDLVERLVELVCAGHDVSSSTLQQSLPAIAITLLPGDKVEEEPESQLRTRVSFHHIHDKSLSGLHVRIGSGGKLN